MDRETYGTIYRWWRAIMTEGSTHDPTCGCVSRYFEHATQPDSPADIFTAAVSCFKAYLKPH